MQLGSWTRDYQEQIQRVVRAGLEPGISGSQGKRPNHWATLPPYIYICIIINCWFSLTWSTAMFFNENKRKRLHNNRVKFPEDLVGAPTWPPFLCLGAPTWRSWRHVKTKDIRGQIENQPLQNTPQRAAKDWQRAANALSALQLIGSCFNFVICLLFIDDFTHFSVILNKFTGLSLFNQHLHDDLKWLWIRYSLSLYYLKLAFLISFGLVYW